MFYLFVWNVCMGGGGGGGGVPLSVPIKILNAIKEKGKDTRERWRRR